MTFEELTRFCELIDSYKYPKTPTLENEESNAFKLFKGLSEGKYETREEAIEGIFGETGTLKKFRELKHELKEKLINTTVLMNPKHPSQSIYGSEYIENNKLWSSMLILIQMKDQDFAMKFGEIAYKKISKGIASDLKFLLSYKLVTNYGFINYNKKKLKYFERELRQARIELDAEILIRKNLADLNCLISSSANYDKVISYFETSLSDLNQIKIEISTVIFNRLFYLFNLKYYSYLNQKSKLKEFCQKNSNKPKDEGTISNFHCHLLNIYICEKNFNKGIIQVEWLKKRIGVNPTIVSFSRLYLIFLFYTYCKKYTEYNKCFEKLENFDKSKLFKSQKDNLKILSAYIHFMDPKSDTEGRKSNFKLNKFLNDLPEASKYKSTTNVSIIIIHILLLLQRKKRKVILDRIESIDQYSYRYLKNGPTLRSNCFIKMLKSITKARFIRKRTISYAQKYINRLQSNPPHLIIDVPVAEIFPYEDLWEKTLEYLD